MVFGLWTALGGHGAPGIELAHNVRSPKDVGVLLADAERAGGTIVRPAARAEWGGTSGAFADPDGYVWEVAHNPTGQSVKMAAYASDPASGLPTESPARVSGCGGARPLSLTVPARWPRSTGPEATGR